MDVQTPHQLPDDIDALKQIIEQQRQKLHAKDTLIARYQSILDKYQARSFGPSSEKHPGQGELQLFNEAELLGADEAADAADTDTDTDDEQTPGTQVSAHTRKRTRQRSLPENLERVVVEHGLSDEQRSCDHCGNALERIGEEVSEQLGIIPLKALCHSHCPG